MSKKLNLTGRYRVDVTFKEKNPRYRGETQLTNKKGKKGKDRKQQPERNNEPEFLKVTYPVWVHKHSQTKQNPENFVWPEYKSDRERIKAVSQKTKNMTIVEAFEHTMGIKVNVKDQDRDIVNAVPTELHVGDELNLRISSIAKNNVVFDTMNIKQMVVSNTNLHRFETFKHFIPTEPLRTRVVAVNPNRVTVDPLAPMLDDWLGPIINNPTIQRVMGAGRTIKVKDLRLTKGGFVGRAVIPNISKYVGEDYTIEAFIPGSQIVLNIESDFNKWIGKTVDAFVTSYIPKPNTIGQMSLICSVKENMKFQGEQNLIAIFNAWCDADVDWQKISDTNYNGVVTGIINSSKKCGVFVEIPELKITGFVNVDASNLGTYPPQKNVVVRIVDIEENVYYDDATGQMTHDVPYVINNNILEKCSIKPILQFV